MSERRRDEKEEKNEKGDGESWDEKWRRDPVEAALWALVLIWVGVVWLLSNTGLWESILGEGAEWWAIGFIGAGLILLLGVPPAAAVSVQLFQLGMTVFTHSNVYLPQWLDRALRPFIVTPDFHRLHHCSEIRHTDSNYGQALPWFDYLFGTASKRPFGEQVDMEIGLEYLREPADSRFDRLLTLPFAWRRRVPADTGRQGSP